MESNPREAHEDEPNKTEIDSGLKNAFAKLQAMAAARSTLDDPKVQEEEAFKAAEEAKKLRASGIFNDN